MPKDYLDSKTRHIEKRFPLHLINQGGRWLIALSGGADSIALALMMKHHHIDTYALHCNFHLRGDESDRDEAFVREFCQAKQIPLQVAHFDTRNEAHQHHESIEMAARRLRYTWFEEQQHHLAAQGICVAHHLDDQAETILLNLIRGTGLQGLQGIQPQRTIGSLNVVRPLLGYTKQELLDYLSSQSQSYVTDSTNLQRDALRNRIRLDVIPLLRQLNPNITQCLARTAENIRLSQTDSPHTHLYQTLQPHGFTRTQIIDISRHLHHPNPTQPSGQQWHSPTHTLTLDRGQIILESRATPRPSSLHTETIDTATHTLSQIDWTDRHTAYIDAQTVSLPLTLRPMQRGDRFRPYGMTHGSKLLSDYLTDRKVPLNEKQHQLVVEDQTHAIVWVAGREIDHRNRITENTKQILKLTIT